MIIAELGDFVKVHQDGVCEVVVVRGDVLEVCGRGGAGLICAELCLWPRPSGA